MKKFLAENISQLKFKSKYSLILQTLVFFRTENACVIVALRDRIRPPYAQRTKSNT